MAAARFFFWSIVATIYFGVRDIQVFAALNSINLVLEVLSIENLNVASVDNLDNSNTVFSRY